MISEQELEKLITAFGRLRDEATAKRELFALGSRAWEYLAGVESAYGYVVDILKTFREEERPYGNETREANHDGATPARHE